MMLHEAMDAAVKERLIVKNPTDGTTIPKNNYAPKQILTEAQLEKFMGMVMQDEVWRDFFYTELTTRLRLGEICGLRWSDFDEATGRLKISRTVKKKKGGGVTWGDTKTETGTRTILLPPSTAEVLRERKKRLMSEWIFPNIYRPEEAMHPEYPFNRMKTLLKQAELPLIRFHDLRHPYVKPKTKKFAYFSQFSFRLRNCSLSSLSAAAKNACSFSFSSGNRHPKVLPPILQ